MRVLVTGGAGFIGSHVCTELDVRGHIPIVLDRHGRWSATDLILGDIRDATAVTDAVAHVDGVIHLAGVLGTQETILNPYPAAETNVLGALNVFEAVAEHHVPAVSIAVGNHWMNSTYAITKTAAERLALMFNAERQTRIAVVRAMNAYGPGQIPSRPYGPSKVRKVMPALICRALANEPVEVYGDGTQIMDMIHVRDVAEILVNALTVDHNIYDEPVEAGTGRPTTVNEIANVVIDTVGQGKIEHLPMRPGETPHAAVLADTSRLPRELRPVKITPLEDGVGETVDWLRSWPS